MISLLDICGRLNLFGDYVMNFFSAIHSVNLSDQNCQNLPLQVLK